jgi:hypothetical protein
MTSPQGNRARKDTGQWLSVKPSLLNGTDLSGQEYTDAMNLRYGRALETFSHIVTAVARRLVFNMLLNARWRNVITSQ